MIANYTRPASVNSTSSASTKESTAFISALCLSFDRASKLAKDYKDQEIVNTQSIHIKKEDRSQYLDNVVSALRSMTNNH
jgi:phospholipid N-methyltransferase